MDPSQLTTEQKQMVLARAQQEANQAVTQGMYVKTLSDNLFRDILFDHTSLQSMIYFKFVDMIGRSVI